MFSSHIAFSHLVYVSGPQLTVFGLYLVGRWACLSHNCRWFPVLRLVVISPEQFRVYGSSEVQPGFCQLSCKE
ncbi:hypothetical protein T01_15422 [Trichinella spiralis]|uniref:Uncharacterized protein n=1 Tax=Trichinella spiralis TaxID=6334 RepID=A0A0V1AUP3_TRISP|nr:hypothetical protein T01_15422 [Trichinella spiralis]